ncbi:unnamed protein product [Moneuplotes crassus]|uniref:Uncharacterized protein n=1 Tax=Euplotes crassus TaxID=5936 RepID=A0AAD1X9N4_EUPCR|nr:unnamed protein product [Moneuplotes crassus]
MDKYKPRCGIKQCPNQADFYCDTHEISLCDQCNAVRCYDCDMIVICSPEKLKQSSELLHGFLRELVRKAEVNDLYVSISGLQEALDDVSEVLKAFEEQVAECLKYYDPIEASKLVMQSKLILSDIFRGTIVSKHGDFNPILRLLFDSQVIDTQKGFFDDPCVNTERTKDLKAMKLVRELTFRNKSIIEDRMKKELEMVKNKAIRETELKMNKIYIPQINSLKEINQSLEDEKCKTDEKLKLSMELCDKTTNELFLEKEQVLRLTEQVEAMKRENTAIKDLCENMKSLNPDKGEICQFPDTTNPGLPEACSVAFLGPTVGKSSLLGRMTGEEFKEDYTFSTGFDYKTIKTEFQGRKVCLKNYDITNSLANMSDTTSSLKYKNVTTSFVKSVQCIFLMYDITKEASLENCQSWVDSLLKNEMTDKIIYLIGNKTDLEDQREISQEAIAEFKSKNNIDFHFEVSAKTGEGVEQLCEHVLKHLFISRQPISIENRPSVYKRKGWFGCMFSTEQ